MNGFSRWFLAGCMVGNVFAAQAADSGAATSYPTKPIRLIVPFAPGGGADTMARLLQPKLVESLGQPIIIDNRAGASGNIGAEMVARSAPDGYTLMMTTANLTIAVSVFSSLPFDVVRDFTAVSLLAKAPSILAVNPSLPAKSVKELIALAQASPGKLNYASDGGGPLEMGVELFKAMAKVDITNVPYKSTGPAAIAVISGEASVIMAPAIAIIPHSKAGKLRALAVTSAQRLDVVRDLPTVAESGVPKFEVSLWYGILMPAKASPALVADLSRRFAQIMQTPEMAARMTNDASIAVGGPPQEFAELLRQDIAKWAVAAKSSRAVAR